MGATMSGRQLFFSSQFQYTFAAHAPTLTVRSGTLLRVVCPDSDNVLSDGSVLPAARRQRDASVALEGNPVAGPIAVEGAETGDCIEVMIDAIHLDRTTGQTGLKAGHGLLRGEAVESAPTHLFRWTIDNAAGVARVDNPLGDSPIVVPLNPFVGCIATGTPSGSVVPTLYSGVFGGNMDLPIIRAGSAVLLPAYQRGGMVMLGDIHAAQGHGEIIGGGIETSGDIDCMISLRKGLTLPAPVIIDATTVSAVGVESELRDSIRSAYANLLNWIVRSCELDRWDAYNLISQTGSVVVGNLLAAPYPVAASVPRAVLPRGKDMM
jgi:acetamidase/formamidase